MAINFSIPYRQTRLGGRYVKESRWNVWVCYKEGQLLCPHFAKWLCCLPITYAVVLCSSPEVPIESFRGPPGLHIHQCCWKDGSSTQFFSVILNGDYVDNSTRPRGPIRQTLSNFQHLFEAVSYCKYAPHVSPLVGELILTGL